MTEVPTRLLEHKSVLGQPREVEVRPTVDHVNRDEGRSVLSGAAH